MCIQSIYYEKEKLIGDVSMNSIIKKLLPIIVILAMVLPATMLSSVALATTTSFYSDYHPESTTVDGELEGFGGDYATVNADTSSYSHDDAGYYMDVGQKYDGAYYIYRDIMLFDTSALPDSISLTSAVLYLWVASDSSTSDFQVWVVSSNPGNNTDLVNDDYDQLGNTSYGYLSTPGISTGWNTIMLNSTGLAAISATGITKFGLKSNSDAYGMAPEGDAYITIAQSDIYGWDSSHMPYLSITYNTIPIVETNAVTLVESTTATGNGNITDTGGVNCTQVGIDWDTNTGVPYANSVTVMGDYSTGTFTVSLTALPQGTTIYCRAKAYNGIWGYGNETTFITKPGDPTAFVANPGDTKVSLSWVPGTGATTTIIRGKEGSYPTNYDTDTDVYNGAGTSFDHTSLDNGDNWYYRAWGNTSSKYSSYAQATATPNSGIPIVSTDSASSMTTNSATLQGTLSSMGNLTTVYVYFQYGLTSGYGTTGAEQTKTATGSFVLIAGQLSSNTLYHYRAIARYNTSYYIYGNDTTFTTSAKGVPVISTGTATLIASTTTTLQGSISSLGDYATVYSYFQYGLTTSYGTDTIEQTKVSIGGFTQSITGLTANTLYHFKAVTRYATGAYVYGNDATFTTSTLGVPTVVTVSAVSITTSTATLQGSISSLGDYSSVYVYFQYGLTTSYGTNTVEQTRTSVGGYIQAITGLTINTTYHYIAVVRYNTSYYAYGSDTTFTTTSTVTLTAPTGLITTRSIGQIALSWLKGTNAVNTVVRSSTITYPSTITDGVQVYFGTGTGVVNTGLTDTQGYYYSLWSEKDGSYASTYATIYVAPIGGAGVSILSNPDTLFIGDVKVFRNYLVSGDQLIVFRYEIGYTTTPTQNVIDFFAFELYDGATLKAKTPVKDWGHRPASIYFSPSNTLTYHQAFTLKVRGIVGKWETIPEGSVSVSASDWDSDINNLDIWVWNEAELINSTDWLAYGASGTVLTTTGCNVFNRAIPALSSIRTKVCAFPSGFPDPEVPVYDDAYESSLDTDTILGTYISGALISGAEKLGADSDDTAKTMALMIGCVLLFIGVGALTKNIVLGIAATSPLLVFGTYADMIPFAATMVVMSILVLYGVGKLWGIVTTR